MLADTSSSSRPVRRGLFSMTVTFATEAAEHLREFERDVAAADDDEMARQHVEIHHRRVGQVVDVVNAGQVGHRGAAAGVEKIFSAVRRSSPTRTVLADSKRAWPRRQGAARCRLSSSPARRGRRPTPCPCALTCLVVDADRAAERDAVVGRAPRQMGGIGAGDHGLGRHAAGVDAGAADSLRSTRRHSCRRPTGGRQGRAGLSGTDYDGVEGRECCRARRAPAWCQCRGRQVRAAPRCGRVRRRRPACGRG
jgi:hypothetical protein